MINADVKTKEAVICCDECLVELARGLYPFNAVDNLPDDCFILSGEGDKPDEHYCNACDSHLSDPIQYPHEI